MFDYGGIKKNIAKLHEKLHIVGGKFKLDDVDIILDENGGGAINIKKWILVSRTTALRFFIYPWVVLVLIPLIIFIIFINYSIVWFIIPFLIMESFGCYIDVYKFFLILKNSERRDKIIIVPSNLNCATVIRVGGNEH